MNNYPDQTQLEERIGKGWEYFGEGWVTFGELFGRFIGDGFFMAHHDQYLH